MTTEDDFARLRFWATERAGAKGNRHIGQHVLRALDALRKERETGWCWRELALELSAFIPPTEPFPWVPA